MAWARDIAIRPPDLVAALKQALNTALDPIAEPAPR